MSAWRALKERIESMLELNNQFYSGQRLSISIGISSCHAAGEVEDATHRADQAMFAAKDQYYKANRIERRYPS